MTVNNGLKNKSMTTPQAIKKHSNPIQTISTNFEETYKTSYSHGLEAIYALENVDIRSIRRIETPSKEHPRKILKQSPSFLPLQEELDFGEEFRGWITPFIKKEPLQVLELSKHSEKCLIENGIKKLGDLIGVNLKELIFMKGLGQGHIEEIHIRLNSYLEGVALDRAYKIDFLSWLKCIVGTHERKRVYALLEPYDLSDYFSLSPSENVEVRKLSSDKKQEWIKDLLLKITDPSQKKVVWADMQLVFNVFFKPWIRRRGGFAQRHELLERMQRISDNSLICSKVLKFLQINFFDDADFLNFFLHSIDQDIYCCDSFSMQDYEMIINRTLSYFYKSGIHYRLSELVCWLEKEFACIWVGFNEGYVEKILRMSPQFNIYRGQSNELEISSSSFLNNRPL